jgi:serine protease Do
VNLQGQVVGVNTAIVSGTRQFAGIGFAMPSNVAIDVYNQIIASGRVTRGWIGIEYTDNREHLEAVGYDQGVLVQGVIEDGPAEAAGLEFGDVITAIDDVPVVRGDDLLNTVVVRGVGDEVHLTVDRLGAELDLTLTIAERPADPRQPVLTDNFPRRGAPGGSEFDSRVLGVTVRPLTSQIRQMPGGQGVDGVLIVGVDSNGRAAEAGLARNLIISEVRIGRSQRILISDVDDFRQAEEVLESTAASTIALRVIDPTAQFTASFVPVPLR